MKEKPVIMEITTKNMAFQNEIHKYLSRYSSWINFFFNKKSNFNYFEEIMNGFLLLFKTLEYYNLIADVLPDFFNEIFHERSSWSDYFIESFPNQDVNTHKRIKDLPDNLKVLFKSINHPIKSLEKGINSHFLAIISENYTINQIDDFSLIITFHSKEALLNYIGFCYSMLKLSTMNKLQLFKRIKSNKNR